MSYLIYNGQYLNFENTRVSVLPGRPIAPTNLSAWPVASNAINLQWTNNTTNAGGYKIERSSNGISYEVKYTRSGNITFWQDSNDIDPSTMYWYRVKAYLGIYDSNYTNEVSCATIFLAPTNFTALAISSSEIDLSWTNNNAKENSYKIERSKNDISNYSQIVSLGTNLYQTSYKDTSLSDASTMYWYRMRTFEASLYTNYTNDVSAITLPLVLLAPTNLTSIYNDPSLLINLSWTDNATNEDGYKIERRTDASVDYSIIATLGVNSSTYQNTNIDVSTLYWYKVRAYKSNNFSNYSNDSSVLAPALNILAPSNLITDSITSHIVNLSWTDNATNEDGYKIERSLNGISYSVIDTLSANSSTYQNSGLDSSTLYWYRVRAYKSIYYSDYSNDSSVITLTTNIAAPTDLSVNVSSTEINLSWIDHAIGEDGYEVERGTTSNNYELLDIIGPDSSTYIDTMFDSSTLYWYRVRAYAGTDYSGYSNDVSIASLYIPNYIYSIGQGGDYSNLDSAFTSINNGDLDPQGGNIILEIIGNVATSNKAVLYESGYSGFTSYNSIIIYPIYEGLQLSMQANNTFIELNGACNITIDGRVNRQSSFGILTIQNEMTEGTGAPLIEFKNHAENNTIKYCNIYGYNRLENGIFTSNTTFTSGSHKNTINNNFIYGNGQTCSYGIYQNDNQYCSLKIIDNYFEYLSSNGDIDTIAIYVKDGIVNISRNHFFEAYILSQPSNYTVIRIESSTNSTSIISGNYIGGNEIQNWTVDGASSAIDSEFRAIDIEATNGTISIQGNTIKNINWTNGAGVGTHWYGICSMGGINVITNIGTITPNIIGDPSEVGSISFTNTGGSYYLKAVYEGGYGTFNFENNFIGSLITNNLTTGYSTNIYGIQIDSISGNKNIKNNLIGSQTTLNNISADSPATGTGQIVIGISNNAAGPNEYITIDGNEIGNLTNKNTRTASSSGRITGIVSTNGNVIITNNIIHDLSIGTGATSSSQTAAVCGIGLAGSVYSKTVSGNTIYNLSNNYTSFNGYVLGIYMSSGLEVGSNIISNNFIHGLKITGTSSQGWIYGIKSGSGAINCYNNIINLSQPSNNPRIYGISDITSASSTYKSYFNTVYLSGSTKGNDTYAYYCVTNASTRDVRNNIFYNDCLGGGNNYAFYYSNSTSTNISFLNNNNYYSTGGPLGYFNGNVNSLPLIPGLDASSLNIDPQFISEGSTNAAAYQISATTLFGDPYTEITTDFAGNTRAFFPTMGAWES